MIKISIVCVGKIKEKFFRDAFDEYRKSGDYKSLPDTEKEIRRNRENNSKGRK